MAYREYRLLRITFPQQEQDLQRVLALLAEVPNPHDEQFSRIAFLVSAYYPPTDQRWLISLGDRLLKRNPTDPDLVYARVRAGLPFFLSPLEKKKELEYANRLMTARPQDLTSYIVLLVIYDISFTAGDISKHRDDGIMTIGLLKKIAKKTQNPALRSWCISEAKTNQMLLDETAKPSPPVSSLPTAVVK